MSTSVAACEIVVLLTAIGIGWWKFRQLKAQNNAGAELVYERELLRTLLDHSADSIFFKDLDSRLVKVSRSEVRNLQRVALSHYRAAHPGQSPEQFPPHLKSTDAFHAFVIGKSDADLYGPNCASQFNQDEREIIRTGQPMIGKVEKVILPDGTKHWHLTTKMPWHDKEGRIIGTFGTARNISDLMEAEARVNEAHKQLLVVSRKAGMAEVATGILHNLGNTLNSINVSTSLLCETTHKSKSPYVGRIANLLQEHRQDLGRFMTQDAKGLALPSYIADLAKHLAEEQAFVLEELASLRKSVEHVNNIVAMQQEYAKVSGVTERVEIKELVEDALRLNEISLERHDIQIIRDYAPTLPAVITDRHKVMQILVNLIHNAKNACEESAGVENHITVRTTEGDGHILVAVIDNGVGITADNLKHIFNQGFTTRKKGHGFGLHSSALAAREIGSTLLAHSDGLGKGATFTLVMPIQAGNE
jgi:signal transduction histidine kinase